MERNLQELFPLYGVENGLLLSKMGDVTMAYEATLPEIFTLSHQEYEALHQTLVKGLKVLPPGTVFHKQDWFIEDRFQAGPMEKNPSFLSCSSERFFQGRPYLHHRCFILLTRKASTRKFSTSLVSTLLKRSMVPQETIQQGLLQEFIQSCGQLERIFSDSGFICLRRLSEEELTGSHNRVGLVEQYLNLNTGALPLLRDVCFQPELRIGHLYPLLFTLADAPDLPSYCGPRINYEKFSNDRTKFSVGFAAPLGLLLPCSHLYNQYIILEDVPKALQRLESRRRRLQSLSAYSRENALARDAVGAFLNEALGEQRLPVKAHFNVLVWTDNVEKLKDLRNLVSSALAQLDAIPREETVGMPQIFWAGLAGNAADFPLNDTFDTFLEQAACFVNLETNYHSTQSPISIRLGERLSGRPVQVDISDEPMKQGLTTNRNKFILGPSGSGKSFFTNHLVRSYYEAGCHIVLVDVGHSYKGLCHLLRGYYFTYEEVDPLCFNPFYIGPGDKLDTEKKESIKTLLLALWKKDDETFLRSEYVALSNALQLYYAYVEEHSGLFPCFNSFYEFLQAEFVEVLKREQVKEKDFDVASFLYVLRPYYRGGEFDYLLNATENLDLLQERFIVFELDNIKDHPILFPVVTIIIMEVFIAKMRKLKGIRKMILIEEAWKALAREGMAEYIRYLFKTVRKYFGEAVVVTQEVEDIISSPVVKQAIINNSDCKILLDQSKYQNKFEQIQELLGLSEKEKTLVLSLNKANEAGKKYKEVFISLGGLLSKVYRTEVSPEEYLAYTTEESEKVKLMQWVEQCGGDMEKGIQAMAEQFRQEQINKERL